MLMPRYRRRNLILIIFIFILVIHTSNYISIKPVKKPSPQILKKDTIDLDINKLDTITEEIETPYNENKNFESPDESAPPDELSSYDNSNEGTVILEKQEIIHAIKEEDDSQELITEELKADEVEDLQSNSRSRRSNIPDQRERIKNNKLEKQITINLDDYSRSELRNIDVAKGSKPFQDFMSQFIQLITSNPLKNKHPHRLKQKNNKPIIPNVQFIQHTNTINEEELLNLLPFTDEFIDELYQKHEKIVSAIPDEIPVDFYDGNGYVMLGGGKYSWYALLVLQILRDRGSKFPVEVVIPNKNEYEEEVCEDVFPSYNAKCLLLSDALGSDTVDKLGNNMNGYQFKALAILASSFRNIFFLDADCFPLTNLDTYFRSEVFKEYKMITWPDFWRRTTSPYYYEVAGIEVSNEKFRHLDDLYTPLDVIHETIPEDPINISYHDRKGTIPDWSAESGGFIIDKKEHFNTLLLALFYNIDGPTGFHPLLSQGGAGEGDKETFTAAANYYNKPYYQVYKKPDKIWGWNNVNGFYDFTTIVQYDAVTDFDNLIKNVFRINKNLETKGRSYDYEYVKDFTNPFSEYNSKPLFYHIHAPKLDPFLMFNERAVFDRNSFNTKRVRILGKDFENIGFDFELMLWNFIKSNLCEEKIRFSAFRRKDMNEFCNREIIDQISFLEDSHDKIAKHEINNDATTLNKDIQNMAKIMNKAQMTASERSNVKRFILSKMNIGTY